MPSEGNGIPSREKATFGAGCFWGVEATFRELNGVTATAVGYCGGEYANPSYPDVCTGLTGHAEVVEVEYKPSEIKYDQLLDVFWQLHDPTTLNRQGPDVGTQYRSVIFFHTPEQESAARKSKEALDLSRRFERSIVTEITRGIPRQPSTAPKSIISDILRNAAWLTAGSSLHFSPPDGRSTRKKAVIRVSCLVIREKHGRGA